MTPELFEQERKAGTRIRKSPLREARFEIPIVRVEIEGAGHLPCVETPAAHAALISDFLKETIDV